MEGPYDLSCNGEAGNKSLQIIKYSPYKPCTMISSSPWFDLRVFYVRVCGIQVDESTPEFLSLNHIPLSPDTLLEVNGVRSSIYSDGEESSVLRRDRVDKKSEEAMWPDVSRPSELEMEEINDSEQLDQILVHAQQNSQPILIDWLVLLSLSLHLLYNFFLL